MVAWENRFLGLGMFEGRCGIGTPFSLTVATSDVVVVDVFAVLVDDEDEFCVEDWELRGKTRNFVFFTKFQN